MQDQRGDDQDGGRGSDPAHDASTDCADASLAALAQFIPVAVGHFDAFQDLISASYAQIQKVSGSHPTEGNYSPGYRSPGKKKRE